MIKTQIVDSAWDVLMEYDYLVPLPKSSVIRIEGQIWPIEETIFDTDYNIYFIVLEK